jgi:hypothetical protein
MKLFIRCEIVIYNRPAELMADVICNNRLPVDTNVNNIGEITAELWSNAQHIRNTISANKEQAQYKQKLYYDKFLHDSRQYAVGDWVKIKNYAKALGEQCQAFVEKFKGPYKIVSILDGLVFKLVSDDGNSEVVHYNRILPFHLINDTK